MDKNACDIIAAHVRVLKTMIHQLVRFNLPRNLVCSGPARDYMIAAVNSALKKLSGVEVFRYNFSLGPNATIKDVFGVSSLQKLQEMQTSQATVAVYEDFTELESENTAYIISELANPPSRFVQVFLTSRFSFYSCLRPRIRSRLRALQLRFPSAYTYEDCAHFSPAAGLTAESMHVLACLNSCKYATAKQIKAFLERCHVNRKTIQMAMVSLPYLCESGSVGQSKSNYCSNIDWDEIKQLADAFQFPSKNILHTLQNLGGL